MPKPPSPYSHRRRSLVAIVLENTLTLFNAINIGIVVAMYLISLATGDQRLVLDTMGIGSVMVINTLVAIVQSLRAQRMLERSYDMFSSTVLVVRNGTEYRVSRDEVVPGETVVLHRGDILSWNAVVVRCNGCELDESLITGEPGTVAGTPGMDVRAGTFLKAGEATVHLSAVQPEEAAAQRPLLLLQPSPLQRNVNRLFTAWLAIALAIAVVYSLFVGENILGNVSAIRTIATLVLGLIPEGLVFFATVSMTMAAGRMGKHGIVVNRARALDTMAATTTVCMDKTGTLTVNTLTVTDAVPLAHHTKHECLALLKAYADASGETGPTTEALQAIEHEGITLGVVLDHTPFSSERKYSSMRTATGTWTLGAPEHVLPDSATIIHEHSGQRLIALAHDGVPVCLCTFDDRLRPDAVRVLHTLHEEGMHVRILTGDSAQHTEAILAQWTERDAFAMDISARLLPDDKRTIVHGLRTTDTVAMVGDGVNDIPAMIESHIGIAMPSSMPATKDVADVVLSASGLSDLPLLIDEGRTVWNNVLIVAGVFIAKNALLIIAMVLSTLHIIPLTLTPRQGAILSLAGIVLPSVLLATLNRYRARVRNFVRTVYRHACITGIAACAILAFEAFVGVSDPQLMLLSVLGCLMGSFLGSPGMDRRTSWYGVLYITVTVTIILLLVFMDTSAFVPYVLRTFYELDVRPLQQLPIATGLMLGSVCTCWCTHLVVTRYVRSRE